MTLSLSRVGCVSVGVLTVLVLATVPVQAGPVMSPFMTSEATVIISDPEYYFRDVTPPLFFDNHWHAWMTRIPRSRGASGYNGIIVHWYSETADANSTWKFDCIALNVSAPPAWDSHGVFTPGMMYDPDTKLFNMFYGGVGPNYVGHHGSDFSEWQGLATSPSPFGPFNRTSPNPILKAPVGPTPLMKTTDTSAEDLPPGYGPWIRLDNPRGLYLEDQTRMFVIKGTDLNFTATPNAFFPAGPGWAAPYSAWPNNPIIGPNAKLFPDGFENNEFFKGPDGLFHLIGSSHGGSPAGKHNPHFVTDRLTRNTTWALAEMHASWSEPAPVAKGLPGVAMEVPEYFIRFEGKPLHVTLYKIGWAPINSTAASLVGMQ